MMHIDLPNWMGGLDNELKSIPITSLSIPGTHDSMTYTITKDAAVAPDAEKFIKQLIKSFGCIIRPIVYRWCVTQTCTVLEQLDLGIRYFDLRLATKDETDGIYFCHGLYGAKVNDVFQDIRDFLDSHPKEIVILDSQHFYAFTDADHDNYICLLEGMFPTMLCPIPPNAADCTLNWMMQNQYRVIAIYRSRHANLKNFLWESDLWPTPWPDTMSTDDLIKFLENRLNKRSHNIGLVSQCVLTPTNGTVVKAPFSGVRSKCAIPTCKAVLPWLDQKQQGSVNVAIADFVQIDNHSFPLTVISLNYKQKLNSLSY